MNKHIDGALAQRDLELLLKAKSSDATTVLLKDLEANHAKKVFAPRLSVLDILEDNADIALPLATFLQMLPAMRIRQYSISSSPLWDPQRATLTLSVVAASVDVVSGVDGAIAPPAEGRGATALKEILDALIPYTERHLTRMEKLLQDSYVVEHLLSEMDDGMFGELGDDDEDADAFAMDVDRSVAVVV